jgi:acyl-CoA hydrolase
VGDILILKSSVNYTGTTSMEVGVRIESENTISGEINHTASAYLTFVSLDDYRKPKAVSPIEPESADEIRRFNEGKMRKDLRKARLMENKK